MTPQARELHLSQPCPEPCRKFRGHSARAGAPSLPGPHHEGASPRGSKPLPRPQGRTPHVLRRWPWDPQHPPESRYLVAELGPRVRGVANEPHLLHGTQNLRVYWRGSPTKHAGTQRLLRLAASLHRNLAGRAQGPTGGTQWFLPLSHCPRTSGFTFCHYKILGLHHRSAEHKCLGQGSGREKRKVLPHVQEEARA